jgi:transcriptional regulator with XRE-family HTH domain
MGKGTPISQELKENIADDLALGYSYGDIAERYGVSFSTIGRISRTKNNSPEAPTAMENASEEKVDTIDTSIISDTEENVKPESQLAELEKSDVHYTRIDGQCRTETDNDGQTEQPNNSRQLEQLDYEEQREYIADILKATLEDIDEEIRGFEERIEMLQASLEERRQKQAYLRDFIRGM